MRGAVGAIESVIIEALLIGMSGSMEVCHRGSPYLLGVGGLRVLFEAVVEVVLEVMVLRLRGALK